MGERLNSIFSVSVPGRIVVGAVMAAAIAVLSHKRRSLSTSGAIAAFVLGTVCVAAGWSWAILLVAFFVSGTLLSRYKSDQKSARTFSVVEKGGNRDGWQVLANGGVFSGAAVMMMISPSTVWPLAGAGAIAAAAADTWATEIGVLSSSKPRSILTGRPVATGQSGGVTMQGSLAGMTGAIAIAVITALSGWGPGAVIAAILGGIGGCTLDSVLGATLQARRWCDHCNTITERPVHSCGNATRAMGGLQWLDNDVVNATSTAFGALLGMAWNLATRS